MSLNDERPHTRTRLPEEPEDGAGPRRPRWFGFVSVVAVIGLLIGAIVIVEHAGSGHDATTGTSGSTDAATDRAGTSPSYSVPPAPTTVATTPIGSLPLPSGTADAVPVGYPHSTAGAEAAAINYAVAYGSPAMSRPGTRHALVTAIAASNVVKSLQAQLDTAYTLLNRALGLNAQGVPPKGQQLVMRMLPVGASVVSANASTAIVSVWADSLSGLSGAGSTHPVAEQWETLRITVAWNGDDWKWVAFSSTPGPTPVNSDQAPSSSQILQNAVDQFGGLRYAP
jgi:hypothetical protein